MTGRRHKTHAGSGGQIVDPRVVVDPAQARQLLAAVTHVGTGARRRQDRDRGRRLHAFFACLYYVGLRPGEAHGLREVDCTLPPSGRGMVQLAGSVPEVGGQHCITKGQRSRRPLKAPRTGGGPAGPRPAGAGVDPAGARRRVRHRTGRTAVLRRPGRQGRPRVAVHPGVEQAREVGLGPARPASPLARRPYDLRHAALSSRLAAGVPPTDVAERAGNSVAVLLTVYAQCLDGQRDTYDDRLGKLLGT